MSTFLNCNVRFFSLDFDSTLGEEVDIPLPSADSKEEVNEEEEPAEEVEEEIEEEEEEENEREGEKVYGPGESGAETSESEAVVVSPRHSRAKSAVQVKSELSTKMHVYAIS